jgi:2-dehydropantoate 2-reductase
MRILIYGAGAVGCYLGGHLALTGHDVTLLGREPLAKAVNSNGLIVRTGPESHHIRSIRAAVNLDEAIDDKRYDWIAFTMKAYDTSSALMELIQLVPDPPPIASFQNGIGNEESIEVVAGEDKVVAATMTTPVSMPEPGMVIEEKARGIAVAMDSPAADLVYSSFENTGLRAGTVDSGPTLKWSKLLLNILGNATSAILDMHPGDVFADPDLFAVEWQALHEALAIMDLSGIKVVNLPGAPTKTLATIVKHVPFPLARPLLRSQITGGRGDKLPSLLNALRSGHRLTEAAWLNGAVTKAADDIQRLAPVNHALALMVSDIAAGRTPWEMYRHRPDMLLTSIRVTQGMPSR